MRRKSPTHLREARLGLLDMGAIGGHALVLMSVGTRGAPYMARVSSRSATAGGVLKERARGIDVTLASSVRSASRG